jgi:hypothetical protein
MYYVSSGHPEIRLARYERREITPVHKISPQNNEVINLLVIPISAHTPEIKQLH